MDMYDYVVCVTCDRRYQQIDFGCATHVLACANPVRGQTVDENADCLYIAKVVSEMTPPPL